MKTQAILAEAASKSTAEAKEKVLKANGLCYVEVSQYFNGDIIYNLTPVRIEYLQCDVV